jgi:hypothetical protein
MKRSQLAAQLRDLLVEPEARKPRLEARAERLRGNPLALDRIAQDVAHLLFRAAAMPPGALLQLCLDVLVEITNHDLSHELIHI